MKAVLFIVVAVATASVPTGYAGRTDNKKACYKNHAYGTHQHSNIAACKAVCDADADADACRIVAWEKLQCSEGYARLDGPGTPCKRCTADAHFAQHRGCGVVCSAISCAHQEHTCPGQSLYEDSSTDEKRIYNINHSQNPFYAALDTATGKRRVIPATECVNGATFHATRTTHPHGRPDKCTTHPAPEGVNTHCGNHGTAETICTRGHTCSVRAGGDCACSPFYKPDNYQAP